MATRFRNQTAALLIAIWAVTVASTDTEDPEEDDGVGINKRSAENNIAFDLPDLTAAVDTLHGKFQIEAFRSANNDRILLEQGIPRASQLLWVSIGQPTLVKTYSSSNDKVGSLFHFTYKGFHTYIQMMTEDHQKKFAGIASAKYKLYIQPSQIVNLILSKFQCSFTLYDKGRHKYLIAGTVTELRHFPLRMDFFAPLDSPERNLFMKLISSSQNTADLQLTCSIASKGKRLLTNSLTINSQQIEQIGLDAKLFGPSSSGPNTVYVTREQSSILAREMYASLNIIEDYEMPETQFSEAFIDGLISQVATSTFEFQPIDSVLAAMSKYSLDISGDLKPDVIKRDLGQILKVERRGDKSRIILDQSAASKYDENWKDSAGFSLGGFGVKASAQWGKENSKSSSQQSQSLSNQLRELNMLSQNDIKWEIEGERVIPKSLNVVQMSRSKFSKTLVFSRVRIQRFDAAFDREFSLYTSRSTPSTSPFDLLNRRLDDMSRQFSQQFVGQSTRFDSVQRSLMNHIEYSFQRQATNLQNATRYLQTYINNEIQSSSSKLVIQWRRDDSQISSSLQSLITSANSRITDLRRKALKRCRICFYQTAGNSNGQCQGSFSTCTPFNHGKTDGFIDDTDDRKGWCRYQWFIECET